ncbi:MAG: c-type cytochrome biogenesis protein CcsB [Bacillota bacterium]
MQSLENDFFIVALIGYFLAMVIFVSYARSQSARTAKLGLAFAGGGAVAELLGLTVRSLQSGHWPFANTYEFTLLMGLGIAAATLIAGTRFHMPGIGIFAAPLIVSLTACAFYIRKAAEPLTPALQSYWLQFHVITATLAYGAFGLAFAMAVMYLVKDRPGNRVQGLQCLIPEPGRLDRLMYGTIVFGFAFQTLVLITGAVWAEEAWGAWWRWDPKETWALITWLVYALYLHGRSRGSWRGRRAAWLSILGFAAVLFTFFGVTYLLSGPHTKYK